MQSLGTDGETQTHALLSPTLAAVPSLLYPASRILEGRRSEQHPTRRHARRRIHNSLRSHSGISRAKALAWTVSSSCGELGR
jgi:hypothetical protein